MAVGRAERQVLKNYWFTVSTVVVFAPFGYVVLTFAITMDAVRRVGVDNSAHSLLVFLTGTPLHLALYAATVAAVGSWISYIAPTLGVPDKLIQREVEKVVAKEGIGLSDNGVVAEVKAAINRLSEIEDAVESRLIQERARKWGRRGSQLNFFASVIAATVAFLAAVAVT